MEKNSSVLSRENKAEIITRDELSKFGERILDTNDHPIGLFREMELEGRRLCDEYVLGSPEFFLVESNRIQAAARDDLSVVIVYSGMLNLIFHLASLAAVGTPVESSSISLEAVQPWKVNMTGWLSKTDFCWECDENWWLHKPERKKLFDFFALNLFRFVVLHEIGHLHNIHAFRKRNFAKFNTKNVAQISGNPLAPSDENLIPTIDVATDEEISKDVLKNQSREIVADTYAFQFLNQELYSEFLDRELRFGKENAVAFASAQVCFSIVNLYFWGQSKLQYFNTPAIAESNYPPHVFRLQAIEATFLEHSVPHLPKSRTFTTLDLSMRKNASLFNSLTDDDGFMEWRLRNNDPTYAQQYEKICAEIPKWSNGVFGISDEEFFKKLGIKK